MTTASTLPAGIENSAYGSIAPKVDTEILDGVNVVFENQFRNATETNFSPTESPYNFSDVHGYTDFSHPFLEMPKKTSKKPSYWMLDMTSIPCDDEGWSYSESLESWMREYKLTLISDSHSTSHSRHPRLSAHKLVAAPFESCGFRRRLWKRLDINSEDKDLAPMKYSPKTSRLFDDDFAGITCNTDSETTDEARSDEYLFYDEDENGFPQASADRHRPRSSKERVAAPEFVLKTLNNPARTPTNTPVDRDQISLPSSPVVSGSLWQCAQSAADCDCRSEHPSSTFSDEVITAVSNEHLFEGPPPASLPTLEVSFPLQHSVATSENATGRTTKDEIVGTGSLRIEPIVMTIGLAVLVASFSVGLCYQLIRKMR